MLSLADIKREPEIRHYLDRADGVLESIGYTEHGRRHAGVVAKRARAVMEALEKPERECELAAIAAYLHDIGNVVNRDHHAQTGATLAHQLLREAGMPIDDTIEVVTAIGHHHETDGAPVSDMAAALILADKSDVHRSRVRDKAMIQLDIHDRVNYAVTHSSLKVVGPRAATEMTGEREDGGPAVGNGGGRAGEESSVEGDTASVTVADLEDDEDIGEKPLITLALKIDTSISPVMEYFEIFLPRMILSNRAADRLGAVYKLVINETTLL
ncbi:MAG: HD domain-containing protein [Gemmatimonadetes bacterium]|nr:HD domain-containing protein [Gemmatimonadota bacterium]